MTAKSENESHALFQVKNLQVDIANKPLIEKLNFEISPREIVAITGRSGCGKTSLLRVLATLTSSAKGDILFKGKTPAEVGYTKYRRLVSLVPQKPTLFDTTVEENFKLAFSYHSAREQNFLSEKAAQLMQKLHISPDKLKQDARSLSIGQQQRVCLIRSALINPEIMLLDEPTSSLDPESVEIVENWLSDIALKNNTAFLVVTHSLSQLNNWCQRKIELNNYLATSK